MTATLGLAVRRLRLARGLKQQALADKSGLAQGFISDLERGRKDNPTQETLQKLATAFDMPLNEFLQEVGMIVPAAVVELQEQGLPEPLVHDLITIWPRMSAEDRGALLAIHRAILARYRVEMPGEQRNGQQPDGVAQVADP
jgi:transcriptional regulator with XRE-family HTH domain